MVTDVHDGVQLVVAHVSLLRSLPLLPLHTRTAHLEVSVQLVVILVEPADDIVADGAGEVVDGEVWNALVETVLDRGARLLGPNLKGVVGAGWVVGDGWWLISG